jgi:hypothetical protein
MAITRFQDMDPLLVKLWARQIRFELGHLGKLRDEAYFTSLKIKYPRMHEVLSAYCGKVLLARTLGTKVPRLRFSRTLF